MLEEVANQQATCEVETKLLPAGMGLATCGFAMPYARHVFRLSHGQQSWLLTVRQDKIDCGGDGYWLEDVATATGNVSAAVVAGDKIVIRVLGCGSERASDYQAMVFNTKESSRNPHMAAKIVNLSDNQTTCSSSSMKAQIISLSAPGLGLSSEEADLLNSTSVIR